jgi:hypothetical protein
MSPLATFIVLFICFALIRHMVKAFKRIKALEAEVVDLQKNMNDHLDTTISLSDIVNKLLDISGDHDTELMRLRIQNLTSKLKEKS